MSKGKPIVLGDKRHTSRMRSPWRRRLLRLVLVTIGISYVAWAMGSMQESTKVKQALLDISRIQAAARLFRMDNKRCPASLDELFSPPGDAMYMQPTDDPWGEAYHFTCPSRRNPGGVDVSSGGPNRSLSGKDNISSL